MMTFRMLAFAMAGGFTRTDVAAIAALANLELDAFELELFARQLGDIPASPDQRRRGGAGRYRQRAADGARRRTRRLGQTRRSAAVPRSRGRARQRARRVARR